VTLIYTYICLCIEYSFILGCQSVQLGVLLCVTHQDSRRNIPKDLKASAAPLREPQILHYKSYYSKRFHNVVMECGFKIVVLPCSSHVGLGV